MWLESSVFWLEPEPANPCTNDALYGVARRTDVVSKEESLVDLVSST